jgi:hypothetical protein
MTRQKLVVAGKVLAMACVAALVCEPLAAQQKAIDADLMPAQAAKRAKEGYAPQEPAYPAQSYNAAQAPASSYPTAPYQPPAQPYPAPAYQLPAQPGASYAPYGAPPQKGGNGQYDRNGLPPANEKTYRSDDLIGAAEGVFGKGAKGLGQVIQDILKKQGQPNGYIVGREAGGAFAVGLRYGSGTLFHKVEGKMPVYWTGPSIGFDAGANAARTFVLVYNLYNTDDLYHRFAAGEGQAYFVGGFHVSYLRRGDVVLIPVRLGVGMRLGINGGYMKISKTSKWFPL